MTFFNYNLLSSDVAQLFPSVWDLSRARLQQLIRTKIPRGRTGLAVNGGNISNTYNLSQDERSRVRINDTGLNGTDRLVFTPIPTPTNSRTFTKTRFNLTLFAEDVGLEEVVLSKGTFAGIDFNGVATKNGLTIYAGGLYDNITGTQFNDSIHGGGRSLLKGGKGDDVYFASSLDIVTELASEGNDTVRTQGDYTLALHLENLTLLGTGNFLGTGNALDNVLVGNQGNNTLDGGTGADTLRGLTGDDTYVVDNAGDKIEEEANSGNDTVLSSVSWQLGDNLENLVLTGQGKLDATGNALNNLLVGNDEDNVISGGKGADVMTGKGGNDIYYVDDVGDVIVEQANGGVDTVYLSSGVNFQLGDNVENIFLLDNHSSFTGNSLSNWIVDHSETGNSSINGGSGNDLITGGEGVDKLTGGHGADIFVVGAGDALIGPGLNNFETITDFEAGLDIIDVPGDNHRTLNVAWTQRKAPAEDFSAEHFNNQFYRMEGLSPGGACAVLLNTAVSPRTFIVIDSNDNGFDLSDNVIEVTGYTGSLYNITVI